MSYKFCLPAFIALFVSFVFLPLSANACGGEQVCSIEEGDYYLIEPSSVAAGEKRPAIFYLHGHRGNALNAVRNPAFQRLADTLKVSIIAVQGVNGTWSFPTAPRSLRDEFSFFDKLLEAAANHHEIDTRRTMITGFSAGGFMTWYLACQNPKRFAGHAPIAGAFWKPLPDECSAAAPVIFHVHGRSDKVVPLAGRALGGGRWHQGDVFKSFDVWRRQFNLTKTSPDRSRDGSLECESWLPSDGVLELCLHDGGHNLRTEWIARAWKKLVELKGWG